MAFRKLSTPLKAFSGLKRIPPSARSPPSPPEPNIPIDDLASATSLNVTNSDLYSTFGLLVQTTGLTRLLPLRLEHGAGGRRGEELDQRLCRRRVLRAHADAGMEDGVVLQFGGQRAQDFRTTPSSMQASAWARRTRRRQRR